MQTENSGQVVLLTDRQGDHLSVIHDGLNLFAQCFILSVKLKRYQSILHIS